MIGPGIGINAEKQTKMEDKHVRFGKQSGQNGKPTFLWMRIIYTNGKAKKKYWNRKKKKKIFRAKVGVYIYWKSKSLAVGPSRAVNGRLPMEIPLPSTEYESRVAC